MVDNVRHFPKPYLVGNRKYNTMRQKAPVPDLDKNSPAPSGIATTCDGPRLPRIVSSGIGGINEMMIGASPPKQISSFGIEIESLTEVLDSKNVQIDEALGHFVPVGVSAQAVVMRLANDAVRLKVLAPAREDKDRDQR